MPPTAKNEPKQCLKCLETKLITKFYISNSKNHADKRHPICKQCISDSFDITKPLKKETIDNAKEILFEMNRPYVEHVYKSTVKWCKDRGQKEIFGTYIKNIQLNFKNYTWSDSDKLNQTDEDDEKEIDDSSTIIEVDADYLENLKEMYGYGYPDEEYILFDKKFKKLKPSFQLPTTMHEEYLREYCINKVKETMAKAKGEFKEAKEWAALATQSADAGKLKPSQMSKADLSQGLDGFGQLARMVEENRDIIGLLPKFIQQPKDQVDVTLWHYINYARDLQGLEPAEYAEIYEFVETQRESIEKQMLDAMKSGESNG